MKLHQIELSKCETNYHCYVCTVCGQEGKFRWNNNPDFKLEKEEYWTQECGPIRKPVKPPEKLSRRAKRKARLEQQRKEQEQQTTKVKTKRRRSKR
jgi:hypothetical protein